ncbi:copper chaperone PCu(A)C [Streptomyces sp. MST-110588]|uniref:copper chaperone PCu(A)C n=1 Tax=Streptomyces sp. MST-110588 TaxID=2833628 RepID=UPI001F5C652A|nr:copper chaperone PCu(A)C [Streptomyces sp. MST-110588]UNO42289.1 copper chaperone PCu(A)C [Streptomyces sp. MST-110588]
MNHRLRRSAGALRGAAVPSAVCLVTLGGLVLWTGAGYAGTPAELRVTDGRILVPSNDEATAAFFTIRNTGTSSDELTGVTAPAGHRAMLGRDIEVARGAHRMEMAGAAAVPARGTLRMAATGLDVMVTPPPRLSPGDRLTFTLHFRDSGDITVQAVAVRPGQPIP